MQCNVIITEVVQQIEGLGNEVILVKLAVELDSTISIKPNTFIIVSINITFSNRPDPIKIVQNLSSNNIIKGNGITPDKLELEGSLWMMQNQNEIIEVVDSKADIYYVSN